MSDSHDNEFFEGLVYEDMLPLEWNGLDAEPDGAYIAHLNESNDDMLRMLAIMEEHFAEKVDEGTNFAAEIMRVEAKINLLLDMVGQILANHLMLPEPVPVRLGSRGIEFAHTAPPGRNDLILLSLYLQQRYPRPLEMVGRVVSVDDAGEGAYWVRVRYEHLSASVQDWLEKFIFRRHRRLVAHSRSASSST